MKANFNNADHRVGMHPTQSPDAPAEHLEDVCLMPASARTRFVIR